MLIDTPNVPRPRCALEMDSIASFYARLVSIQQHFSDATDQELFFAKIDLG
jgi:hypothetical protein